MKVFGLVLLGCVVVALANNLQNPQQQQQQQQQQGSVQNQNPEVQTALGKIRGSVMQTRLGQTIYAYRGVRYAEAPVGEYRFKQAVPAKPYSQTLDASQDGPACPQPGNNRTQSEDCLRLNIYTRQAPSSSNYILSGSQQSLPGQQCQQGQQGLQCQQGQQGLRYQGQQQQGNQQQYPSGNQGQYPSGNQGQYPSGNQGQYPSGNQGQYLSENQQQYPSGNQGQGQSPSGNQGQSPSGNQGQSPLGNQGQYLSGNQQQYPSGSQQQYPSGSQQQYPSGNQGQSLSGNQQQSPSGNQGQSPSGNQGQYLSGNQQQNPSGNQQQYPSGNQQQYPSGNQQQNPSGNVYSQSAAGRDVVVFFHPDGFYSYAGTSADFGPEYLLDHDVVLVTVNYRLGSLGFLSTGDSHAPGNVGLKDQVEALRYIQKNIAKFGGNPNSVTIMGYSTGAWSVSLHMVSPMSKGLFHRAIAMSGAATYQNSLPTNQEHIARKQAQLLGCPTDSHESLINCLRSKPVEAFSNSVPQFAEWQNDPIFIWSPVVEPEVAGVERFLPAQPADLIREKKINPAPLLTGSNRDEFGSVIIKPTEQAQQGNSSIFDDINANWARIAPISFYYDRNGSKSSRISKELKSYYLRDQPVNVNNVRGLAQLYGDALVSFQSYRFAKLMAENSPQPVYNYHFVAEGRDSYAKWSNGSNYGVVHLDDLLYLFKVANYPQYSSADAREVKTLERYTAIVANFARSGQPIPSNDPNFSNVNWQPTSASQPQYLEFGNEISIKSGHINAERMHKLEELFPLPPVGQLSQDQQSSQSDNHHVHH